MHKYKQGTKFSTTGEKFEWVINSNTLDRWGKPVYHMNIWYDNNPIRTKMEQVFITQMTEEQLDLMYTKLHSQSIEELDKEWDDC